MLWVQYLKFVEGLKVVDRQIVEPVAARDSGVASLFVILISTLGTVANLQFTLGDEKK